MRVAVPVWGERVSPVFDAAGQLLIVGYEDGREVSRHLVELPASSIAARVNALKTSRAEVLLCGAISRPLLDMLRAEKIEVTPFLAGDVENLLAAFLAGRLADSRYLMPGCCGRRRNRCGHGPDHRNRGRNTS